jgi:phosphoenolpyruvate carboxylase
MTPIERYARNFAKVVYNEANLECLSNTDRQQISKVFNKFKPEYHETIAEYPLWINQPKNMTPRDRRRVKQYQREERWPIFMFSHARILAYLEQAE